MKNDNFKSNNKDKHNHNSSLKSEEFILNEVEESRREILAGKGKKLNSLRELR